MSRLRWRSTPILWWSHSEEGRLDPGFASLSLVSDDIASTGPTASAGSSSRSALTPATSWHCRVSWNFLGVVSEASAAGSANEGAQHAKFAPSWSVFPACHSRTAKQAGKKTTTKRQASVVRMEMQTIADAPGIAPLAVVPVEVHNLVPGGHEVTDELVLRVRARTPRRWRGARGSSRTRGRRRWRST
jgi:hypothetical protein